MFSTPILFIIFDNKDTSLKVFQQISIIKPTKLYIASDGGRNNKQGEKEKVEHLRKSILSLIDWECEVKTFFRKDNKGTSSGIVEFIDWFFSHEEEGIILEHDCLPDMSFFHFCEHTLKLYRHTHQVMHISGYTTLDFTLSEDYYFSYLPNIWGWATWRRAWLEYSLDMKGLHSFLHGNSLKKIIPHKFWFRWWWKEMFISAYIGSKKHNFSTWDFQWTYAIWKNNGYCVSPTKNLVRNIGFGEFAVHTKDPNHKLAQPKVSSITGTIRDPQKIIIDYKKNFLTLQETFDIHWYSFLIVLCGNIFRTIGIYSYMKKLYDRLLTH